VFNVPASAILYLTLGMDNGAAKYGAYNWRENAVIASIYLSAAMRHILAFQDGEEDADDSGLPHLAHAMSCLGIIVDAKETGNLIDDRPKAGAAAKIIRRYTKS
jgi:hypothetical protein